MRTLILSAAAIAISVVVSVTFILIFSPESDVAPIIGLVGSTLTSMATLGGLSMVKGDTSKMVNGHMDKKIQENVTTVLVDQGLAGNGHTPPPAEPVHDPTNTIPAL